MKKLIIPFAVIFMAGLLYALNFNVATSTSLSTTKGDVLVFAQYDYQGILISSRSVIMPYNMTANVTLTVNGQIQE